ncbi:protein kinase domain-containing protein [Gemmatimonas sp.]|uniref:protein kinase domain-containing protein n=1 Tax=Gemmatimonas sp. TaxID=1962908 RepID=UPI00398348B3
MTDLRTQLQSTLGPGYTLERELGGGGMSRVFVARENALGREVVVKVIAPELAEGVSAERFTREIATAARLQQANIVPVLTAGASGGVPYYTMPFVKGESLRALMARGTVLSLHDRVNLLRDVARALAYAHSEGVVHRDIKPDNILLSAGTAVVTDFGIAKAISASRTIDGVAPASPDGTLTQAGSSIGTPAYMAPEQAVGDVVDHRADLYAWGVVAYELLSGAHPFAGKAGPSQLIAAHLAELPAPLASRMPELPREVAALVMQCLAKSPSERPVNANALLERLATVSTPSAERAAAPVPASRRGVMMVASAALLAVAAGGLWIARGRAPGGAVDGNASTAGATVAASRAVEPAGVISALAVLPFVNTSGDAADEYFSDGLTDELAHGLSKLPGLRLAGRTSSFAFKGKTIQAAEVGRALNVGAIIEGTVRRAGNRIRLTAQLTSTRDGQLLWSDAFERTGADVFAVQDAFTSAIVSALTPRLAGASGGNANPAARATVAARGTTDAVAYDLYLKGRFYWAQRGAAAGDSSIKYLEATVQRDSTFARGWAGLALAHVIRPNYNAAVDFDASDASAEIAVRRALSLDSTLADAYAARGFLLMRRLDLARSAAEFATARRLEPQNAIAAHWSASQFHAAGDTAQSDRQMEIALTLDPLSPTTFNSHALMLTERRRFGPAMENYGRVFAINPAFPNTSVIALVWSGLADSAFAVSQRGLATAARARFGNAILAAAASRRWDAARTLRDRITAGGPGITAYDRAMSSVVFGNNAAAATAFIEHLEHGGGLANIAFSVCHPPYDAIRTEPAWKAFLVRHRLRECPYASPWPVSAAL